MMTMLNAYYNRNTHYALSSEKKRKLLRGLGQVLHFGGKVA